MGGLNHAAALKHLGVSKGTVYRAPVTAFTLPPKGHYLHDPTSRTTPDEARVQSIMEFGMDAPLHVVNDGGTLYVHRGRKRVVDGLEAAERLRRARKPEPIYPYILVELEDAAAKEMMDVENFHRSVPTEADVAFRVADYRRKSYPDDRICYLLHLTDRDGKPYDGKRAKRACDDYAAIASADPAVLKALGAGEIGKVAATKLARKPRAVQETRVKKLKETKARGTRAKAVVEGREPEPKGKPAPRSVPSASLRVLVDVVADRIARARATGDGPARVYEAVHAALFYAYNGDVSLLASVDRELAESLEDARTGKGTLL